jgi:PEP-CTERM motif
VRDSAAANSMQISDIRFETIPEPTTALLGALGALGLVTRRRRA